MIISAFPFLNELDLLEYRLRTMSPMVDLFVLMESPVTFSGKPKPLYFSENKERFAQWSIHHLVVEERPGDVLWEREKHQRAMLLAEVDKLAPEIAIFSDCDEIVRPDTVERFRAAGHEMMRFDLDMPKFYVDRLDTMRWVQGCIQRWRSGLEPELRGGFSPVLENAGWHFEYIGRRELLLEKIAAVSHGPEPAGMDFHAKVSRGILDGYERTVPYPITSLPQPMQDDIQRIADLGWLKNRFPLRKQTKTMRSAFTIVFNGDFLLEQVIENVLPVVDRYVVVEGATRRMKHISNNGASTDRTNEILDKLARENPKLRVIHGTWLDKTEMCNAALELLEPGLLWQIDADEVYHAEEMVKIMDWMDTHPQCTDVEFWGYHFFGGFKYHTVMEDGRWGNNPPWRRLFRWNGELWRSHTPPRLERNENILQRGDSASIAGMLHHYGYCFPRQVLEKGIYHNDEFHGQQFEEFSRVARGDLMDKALVEFTGKHPIKI